MITCKNLYKSYPTGTLGLKRRNALAQVSFAIEENEVFGIVGPNGAGKSTIIKILMGFIRADEGDATIATLPVSSYSAHEKIGYLPENPCLYPHLTLSEHLDFACAIDEIAKNKQKAAIERTLEIVAMKEHARIQIKKYSKGMTQRAALAYAIISSPELLILDEPMSGLDPIGRRMVIDLMVEHRNNGGTILFCSHILTDVERICDRIGIMNHGRLLDIVTPDSLASNPEFTQHQLKTPLESYFDKTIKQDTL